MDTDYFEDELWKCETIENEAKVVLHNMHVSINRTRAACINFDSFSIDSVESKTNNRNGTFFIEK